MFKLLQEIEWGVSWLGPYFFQVCWAENLFIFCKWILRWRKGKHWPLLVCWGYIPDPKVLGLRLASCCWIFMCFFFWLGQWTFRSVSAICSPDKRSVLFVLFTRCWWISHPLWIEVLTYVLFYLFFSSNVCLHPCNLLKTVTRSKS